MHSQHKTKKIQAILKVNVPLQMIIVGSMDIIEYNKYGELWRKAENPRP